MVQWVIQGKLARGHRPGYAGEGRVQVTRAEVDGWIQEVRDQGVKSIICLLGEDQLCLYNCLPSGLVEYYRQSGFQVEHVPALDHQLPPLSEEQLRQVWNAFRNLPKPVLVHCSAGVDRTGRAIKYVRWQEIQEAIRACLECERLKGELFGCFDRGWPEIPPSLPEPILFISEAPPRNGGFWGIQPAGEKQDDLREKLLPLVGVSPVGDERGLNDFRGRGFFLLQSFQRPLAMAVGNASIALLNELLRHPAGLHLREQMEFFSPCGLLALGRTASAALSLIYPTSSFGQAFESSGFSKVQGKIFQEVCKPLLGATYLPSGNGRFWKSFWQRDIPEFVRRARLVDRTA